MSKIWKTCHERLQTAREPGQTRSHVCYNWQSYWDWATKTLQNFYHSTIHSNASHIATTFNECPVYFWTFFGHTLPLHAFFLTFGKRMFILCQCMLEAYNLVCNMILTNIWLESLKL